jgi:capsular polysaccharide transport system permease protein
MSLGAETRRLSHAESIPRGRIGRFFFELREGARRQGNVIFALIFRELKTKSGQDSYGLLSFVGIVLEPAVTVITLSLFWYLLKRQEILGVHVALFVTVSVTGFAIVRRSFASIPRSVRSSRAFYAYPNVKPFDAILARFIVEFILTLMGGLLVLFLIWWFLDLKLEMSHFIDAMRIFGELVIFAFGIALVMGVYGTRFPFIMTVFSNVSRILFYISSVIHPTSDLPIEAQVWIAWNPFAHAMELGRLYLLNIAPFAGISETYLFFWSLSTLAFGFVAYYANRKKVLER